VGVRFPILGPLEVLFGGVAVGAERWDSALFCCGREAYVVGRTVPPSEEIRANMC
jgi:hypothetical protein